MLKIQNAAGEFEVRPSTTNGVVRVIGNESCSALTTRTLNKLTIASNSVVKHAQLPWGPNFSARRVTGSDMLKVLLAICTTLPFEPPSTPPHEWPAIALLTRHLELSSADFGSQVCTSAAELANRH
jgi:hypothetical protein